MASKVRVSRRRLVVGAACVTAAAGLEYASFRGAFDHRSWPGAAGVQRYAASLGALAREDARSGLVHIGHSTHLVVLGGVRFLTDPWFYDPAFGALRHDVFPAVAPAGLGELDAVLITHDHADHADLRALDEMDKRATIYAPTAELSARVRSLGFRELVLLRPWEAHRLRGITVTAVPGLHDIYEVGYVLQGDGQSVYFAGDTRLHPDLPALAERFAPTAAILPVDGTRLTGSALQVMTPADAVSAARILGVKLVVPSHAEARFSDPLAEHVLASTVPQARQRFFELMTAQLPGVACGMPEPGGLVRL
jgi:L-ascorbate metabolism protein UlaG (beta-lactamase superfamily)